jgi:CPA2 family monovalent cation:H+ antiporter-2
VLGSVIGLVGLKAAITFGLARGFRVRGGAALQSALLLGPGGEFGFVIIGLAISLGLLQGDLGQFLFLITALSMAAIPTLSWVGRRLAPRPVAKPSLDLLPPSHPAHGGVIIAGFGRVGRTVAAMLDAHDIAWVALDSDIARVSEARKAKPSVFYGDMTQAALLNSVGLDTARALVVTIDDRSRADTIVQIAHAARPDLLIVVRARDAKHAAHLYRVGATDAVPETIEASLQLSEAVLVDLGVPMGPVLVSIHEQRARFQADIRRMAPDATIRTRARKRLREAAPAAPPVD